VTPEEARRLVEENDEAQRAFIRQAFRQDVDDPAGFDLVVNVLGLGLPAAVTAAGENLRDVLCHPHCQRRARHAP
jgi:hypothetical protein